MNIVDVTLELLQTMPLPEPGNATDKDTRGRVFLIAGSAISPGASLLAGEAALRSGAGKVLAGIPKAFAVAVAGVAPELGILSLEQTNKGEIDANDFDKIEQSLGHCDAVLVGPGFMDEDNAGTLATRLLKATDRPIVLDAAAITAFRDDAASLKNAHCIPILTPHAGEMSALSGRSNHELENDPIKVALATANRFGSIIVFKGATTYIAHPNGEAWRHRGGVTGLATAGSGDVLAGLLIGLIARGTPAISACLWSVYLHAKAGAYLARTIGSLGFLARELPAVLPRMLDESTGAGAT
jgi:ADP-dependent NAD(P)H-hydrate dehydratase